MKEVSMINAYNSDVITHVIPMACMMVGFESQLHAKGFMKWAFIKEVAHVMKQYSIVKWLEQFSEENT